MNRYIVIASPKEVTLLDMLPIDQVLPIIITGVGATNVINALKDIPRDSFIYNIGYAGCPNVPIGTMVQIGRARLFHQVDYQEQTYELGEGMPCYTSTDFVTSDVKQGCVYDMELAIICALGFQSVRSYKVISDNCNYSQFKQTLND